LTAEQQHHRGDNDEQLDARRAGPRPGQRGQLTEPTSPVSSEASGWGSEDGHEGRHALSAKPSYTSLMSQDHRDGVSR
jgi:hypothetical protein